MKTIVLARDVMSRPVRRLTIRATVRDAAEFMVRWGISGAPVIDDHGQWVGVFTLRDIARHVQKRLVDPEAGGRTLESREPAPPGDPVLPEELSRTPVVRLMTPGIVTVFPDATIEEVVRSMTSLKIHRVFVLGGKSDELEGVITTLDVLCWLDANARKGRARVASR